LCVWRERGGSDYCRAAIQQQHCEENNIIVASTWQIQLLRLEGLVRMPEAGRHYPFAAALRQIEISTQGLVVRAERNGMHDKPSWKRKVEQRSTMVYTTGYARWEMG
jgi:hypothetical protein